MDGAETLSEVAETILQRMPGEEYPYLLELTARHVMQPGYDYGDEYEVRLDLILDGPERALQGT